MKPSDYPRKNMFVVPRDFPSVRMHYAIVQVSKHRYVVVEYSGTTSLPDYLPTFRTVSEPMVYDQATSLAIRFRDNRLNRKD